MIVHIFYLQYQSVLDKMQNFFLTVILINASMGFVPCRKLSVVIDGFLVTYLRLIVTIADDRKRDMWRHAVEFEERR